MLDGFIESFPTFVFASFSELQSGSDAAQWYHVANRPENAIGLSN